MGFKTDREFLRNLTVGAIGTRRVADILRKGGCEIIELERYSQNNKIWATKVKRLRVPDLLCLRCGSRIESRAKSNLAVIMSHAVNNPDRAWDKGLRDYDLVACIKCTVTEEMRWEASDNLPMFTIGALRSTIHSAKQSRMKSTAEGSEVYLTWPTVVPKRAGEVLSVRDDAISVRFDAGNRYTYRLIRKHGGTEIQLNPHVNTGDRFGAGSHVIASVMPKMVSIACQASDQRYDFLTDIDSGEREIVYGAVKALGFLPELRPSSIDHLKTIQNTHEDALVRLEAAASLARLDEDIGWKTIEKASEEVGEAQVRMESVLILGELPGQRSTDILSEIAKDTSNPSDLRAAAVWGMGSAAPHIDRTPLLELIDEQDETTALHAIIAASRLITDNTVSDVLADIGQDAHKSAAIVKAIQCAPCDPVPQVVTRLQNAEGATRQWLLYLLATLGRKRCEEYIFAHAPELISELEFFWGYHNENWTNRLDITDQVDFLLGQVLD